MTWQQFMQDQIMRIVLISWFVSSFLILFMLGQLDWIVHHELYNFNLQFSLIWAQPYWITLRLIHICLACPSILGAIALVFDFWTKFNSKKQVSSRVSKSVDVKVQPLKENSMLISCPSCEKTFSKPLVMLDFTGKNAKLVNVCPYCNAKLGEADERDEKDLDTRVLSPDEKAKIR